MIDIIEPTLQTVEALMKLDLASGVDIEIRFNMTIGLIGTKIGMTREFLKTGQSVPVTVIKVEKGRVLDVIKKEKHGYNAIKVGFFKLKNSKLTKQMKGYFAKKNTEPKKILKELELKIMINLKRVMN